MKLKTAPDNDKQQLCKAASATSSGVGYTLQKPLTEQAQITRQRSFTYKGQTPDHRHRVVVDGRRALVSGELYRLFGKRTAKGLHKGIRLLIGITPGYRLGNTEGESVDFIAYDKKARCYHVIGKLLYVSTFVGVQYPSVKPLSINSAPTAIPSATTTPNREDKKPDHLSATPFLPLATASPEPQHLERAARHVVTTNLPQPH